MKSTQQVIDKEGPQNGRWSFAAIAVGIGIVGLLLRSFQLGKQSLWFDELMTWWFAKDFATALAAESTNPPFYYLLIHFWMRLFGIGEVALRIPSVLASTAALATTWLIARKLHFSNRTAMLAVALQSISVFHIEYAQEARVHALLVLWLSTAFLVLMKGTEDYDKHRRKGFLILYALMAGLSMYMHFVASFYMLTHGVYVLVRYRKNLRVVFAFAVAGFFACLLYGPWLVRMLTTAATHGQFRRYLWLKLPQAWFSFLFGDTLIPLDEAAVQHLRQTLAEFAPILVLAVLCTAVIAVFVISALRRVESRASWAVALLAILPGVIALTVSVLGTPMIDERYLLSSTPFIFIGFAAGIDYMLAGASRRTKAMNGLAALAVAGYGGLVLLSLFNYHFNPRYGKEQWRDALAMIDSQAPESSLVVYDPDFVEVARGYYDRRPLPFRRVSPELKQAMLSSEAKVQEVVGGYQSIWLVRCLERDDDVLHLFQRTLVEKQHVYYPKGNGIDVYRFEPSPAAK